MKKLIINILVLWAIPLQILADNIGSAFDKVKIVAGQNGAGYNTQNPSIEIVIGSIIQTLLSLLGIIFLVLIIYGGYLWMIDRGNEQEVSKAKKIIQYAIIGLAIVLSAYAISYFVLDAITTTTLQAGTPTP